MDLAMESERSNQNPLLNLLILDTTFRCLKNVISANDLKHCRLVCKLWDNATRVLYRQTCCLCLGPPDRNIKTRSYVLNECQAHKKIPVNVFLHKMKDANDPLGLHEQPFVNLTLCDIDFSTGIPDIFKVSNIKKSVLHNFWAFLNNSNVPFRSIGFKNCVFNDFMFAKIVTENLSFCETLKIHESTRNEPTRSNRKTTSMYRDWDTKTCQIKHLIISGNVPMKFRMFIRSCVNLKELSISNSYDSEKQRLKNLVFNRVNANVEFKAFTKLDVMYSRFMQSQSHVLLLEEHREAARISLEFLSMTLETFKPSRRLDEFVDSNQNDVDFILRPMLQAFAGSLKVLHVFRAPIHATPIGLCVPCRMTSLEELCIYGNLTNTFSFLKHTPNLKKLMIDIYCLTELNHLEILYFRKQSPAKLKWFAQYYKPYTNDLLVSTNQFVKRKLVLQHLVELDMQFTMTNDTIHFFGRAMPNLKRFKAIVTESVWIGICRYLTTLEELVIRRRSTITDSDISGYENMQHAKNPSTHHVKRNANNVTSLQNLRLFEYQGSCGSCRIGDTSVLFGLLQLPKLHTLRLMVGHDLSSDVEKRLLLSIPHVSICRNASKRCNDNYDCCRETRFLERLNESNQ